jgi:hypothetical protein
MEILDEDGIFWDLALFNEFGKKETPDPKMFKKLEKWGKWVNLRKKWKFRKKGQIWSNFVKFG